MSLFDKTCNEGGDHEFEPRFDEVSTNQVVDDEVLEVLISRLPKAFSPNNFASVLSTLIFSETKKTYVKDVCIYCGKEIQRNQR